MAICGCRRALLRLLLSVSCLRLTTLRALVSLTRLPAKSFQRSRPTCFSSPSFARHAMSSQARMSAMALGAAADCLVNRTSAASSTRCVRLATRAMQRLKCL
jgi:hypothetical protein